jgi:nitroreductase
MTLNNNQIAEAFEELATGRHSCRAFLDAKLDDAKIENLLSLAQRAPSDCNTQAWKTYVLSGEPLEALRTQLYDHVMGSGPNSYDLAPIGQYSGVWLERRRACGWSLYEAVGIQKGDRVASRNQALENFRFFGAPHLAVITSEASLGERGVFDAGIYLGFFLLAAQALQIAAVPQAAVSHYTDLLRRAFGIPAESRIISVVAFGEEDRMHPANSFRTTRADLSEAVVLKA